MSGLLTGDVLARMRSGAILVSSQGVRERVWALYSPLGADPRGFRQAVPARSGKAARSRLRKVGALVERVSWTSAEYQDARATVQGAPA